MNRSPIIFSFTFILSLFFIVGCNDPLKKKSKEETPVEEICIQKKEYGIVVDSLFVLKSKIKRGENLSEILTKYCIDYSVIDRLAEKSKEVLDVRKFRSGNKYTVICNNDSIQQALYFIYERTPIEYIVYDLRDSIHIHKGQKEIDTEIKIISGKITSSLWNAVTDNGGQPMLAVELSDVYAWTIDFFGIKKNDSFKVVYEEISVEGEIIGTGKILASNFNHIGQDNYAFYFVQDTIGDYFDEKGNSLRKAFLKAPLRYRRISSKFSYSRLHPIYKVRRPHLGVDYAAPTGTPVSTVGDGVVTFAKRKGGAGKMVTVKHNSAYTTKYLHLSKYGPGIKPGVRVKQGDIIGYVGSTGASTGPHLDFRFYKNGKAVDPLKVESPPAKPVDSLYRDEFFKEMDSVMSVLKFSK